MSLLLFGRRLKAAWALMACVALLQGGVAWWAIGEATREVARGRVASDLLGAYADMVATKQALRAWVAEAVLNGEVEPTRRPQLQLQLRAQVLALERLHATAEQLEPAAQALHAARRASLAGLRDGLTLLEALPLGPGLPGQAPAEAWRAAQARFDSADSGRLRPLLQAAVQREQQALTAKRLAADRSLARVQTLALGATALLALLAALLAAGFARALRHPMADAAERAQQLDAALTRLTEQAQRRRQWLADISHELRTPTTAIRGEAEIALRGADKPAASYRDSLARIADGAKHLGGLIDDLLLLARAESDGSQGLQLQPEPLDARPLLEQALAQAAPLAAERGVALQAEPLPAALPLVADAQRLRQILLLLLDNALAYTPAGGQVGVSVGQLGGQWQFRVSDSGIGIEAGELDRVFERGVRGAAARRLRADGSGLGLPLARALAEAQGASLSLHSPGVSQGTTALLEWPCSTS